MVTARPAAPLASALHVNAVRLVDEVGSPLAVSGQSVQQAERIFPDRLLVSALLNAGGGLEPGHRVQQDPVLALDYRDRRDEPRFFLDHLRQQALRSFALLNVVPERLGQRADLNGDVPVPAAGFLPDRAGQGFLQVDGRPADAPAMLARSLDRVAVG
jgi:hypothetical protein